MAKYIKYGLFDIVEVIYLRRNIQGRIIGIENLGYGKELYFLLIRKEENILDLIVTNEDNIVSLISVSKYCTRCKNICRLFTLNLCEFCNVDEKFKKNKKDLYYIGEKVFVSGLPHNVVYGIYHKSLLGIIKLDRSFFISSLNKNSHFRARLEKGNVVFKKLSYFYDLISEDEESTYSYENIRYLVRGKDNEEFKLDSRDLYTIVESTTVNKDSIPEIIPKSHVVKLNVCERCIYNDCLSCKVNLFKL